MSIITIETENYTYKMHLMKSANICDDLSVQDSFKTISKWGRLMERERNTTVTGDSFDEKIIDAVWNKAVTIKGMDPKEYRHDMLGNELCRSSYGRKSIMGWEIDHIKPVSKGGTDDLDNLQALQSKANMIKGDTYPWP